MERENEKIIEALYALGLVPVVRLEDAEDAVPLARALCAGGLPAAEITFRTGAAAESIRRIHAAAPEMLLIAGTVLSPAQADAAMEAGAGMIVSPGFNPDVVRHCLGKGYPVVPGCATPSEFEQALALGLTAVKFFPAGPMGGVGMLKAVSAPYGQLRFMPTGGVSLQNIGDYLDFPKVFCCGGSFMVPSDAIAAGDFNRVTELARAGVRAVHRLTVDSFPGEGALSPAERAFGFGERLALRVRSLKRFSAYLRLMGAAVETDGETLRCRLGGLDAAVTEG